ncbi:hypothetical protein V1264_020383 [Littorina saxatilis]|uniref:ribonuclease H n=1 Tax=Littorina saxatilis TaxID=31220 RepID=A0AAN9BBM2_9CAEN
MIVPQIAPKDCQSDHARRSLTLAMIAGQYPCESWIYVYTDGSATDAVANGGAGVYASFPEGHTTTTNIPTGKHCSKYSAEIQALVQAASIIQDSSSECLQAVFLTDALSVLEALAGGKLPHLMLMEKLHNVEQQRRVVLQWLPAHCGIPGNERADKLAKLGAQGDQTDNPVNFMEKKTLIKTVFRPQKRKDDYHLLTRHEQVVLMRHRTGHNRLNAHMSQKIKLVPSSTCSCGLEDQTTEHILQRCTILESLRKTVWPTAVSLHSKLFGGKEDLEKTASFVSLSGLTV